MAHRPRGPVVLTGYTSRPDSLSYFLSELKTIRESQIFEPYEVEVLDHEEDDANAEWLKKAGFENFVEILENTQGDDKVLENTEFESHTAALPKSHAEAIHKRMHTLRSTIRSRHGKEGNGESRHGDVRNLFGKDNHEESQFRVQKSKSCQLLSIERLKVTPPPDETSTDTKHHTQTPPGTPPRRHRVIPSNDVSSQNRSTSPHFISLRNQSTPPPDTPPKCGTTPPPNDVSKKTSSMPISSRKSSTPPSTHNMLSSKHKTNGIAKSSSSIPSTNTTTPSDMKLSFRLPVHGKQLEDELPSITLDADPLGITQIDDLSSEDMVKVQCLAHIELSVTFDENNIPLRSLRNRKYKINDDQLFGVPLSTLLQKDQRRDPKARIPLLIKEMIEYLEKVGFNEEGILRVSGSRQRIAAIKDELDATFNCGVFSFEGKKTADVASLLKQLIRDLPVPLLTRENLPAFALISDISNLKERVRTLNLLVLMLPTLHQRVLKRLLIFCEKIHCEREVTKMDITNISMVLAPNLFLSLPASKLNCDDVTLAAKTSHVVMLLIKYHVVLWTIPDGMLTQVRFLYESELKKVNERNIKQVLQKMSPVDTSSSRSKPQEAGSHYIIRVKAPVFTWVSKAINIQENPTAGTVVAKLRKRSQIKRDVVRRISSASLGEGGSPSDDSLDECDDVDVGELFLYEVGGNIGERRLDPNTNMLCLYDVNPHAQWIVKPQSYPSTNTLTVT